MLPQILVAATLLSSQVPTISPATPSADGRAPVTAPVTASATGAVAAAATDQPDLKPLAVDVDTPELLEALHQRGLNLKGFTADVTKTDTDQGSGAVTTYTAKLVYDADAGSIRVDFLTRDEGSGPKTYKTTYMLQKGLLTTRDFRAKHETHQQVAKPDEKINLLKLGEGPFPLPIGQQPAEVEKQFDVDRPADSDPRPCARLIPKAGTDLGTKFKQIVVWTDNATHFPTKIVTTDKTEANKITTELSNLQVNPSLSPKDFELPAVPADWTTTDKPYEN